MLKVCHVTSVHPAKDGRIYERECRSLAKKYEVYLVAPNTETRVENGVNIIGVSLPAVHQRIRRLFYLRNILKLLYEVDAELYHFHDPELIGLGIKLKRRGKKIIFDSHEDVVNQIKNKTYIPSIIRKVVEKLYASYERRHLREYTALISVTGYIVNRLKKINPNTFQVTNYPIFEKRNMEKRRWDRSLCFAGLLTQYWRLNEIIAGLPSTKSKLYLAGKKYSEEYFNQLKILPGWRNVEYLGVLSHDDVLKIYEKVSVGLAIEGYDNPNAGFRVGSLGCTKIPEYMSVGLPVVVSNSEVWGEIVRKYDCGVVVDDPNNKEEIARAINSVLSDTNRAKEMGENALKAAKEEFNWDSQEKVLLEMYHNILGE